MICNLQKKGPNAESLFHSAPVSLNSVFADLCKPPVLKHVKLLHFFKRRHSSSSFFYCNCAHLITDEHFVK